MQQLHQLCCITMFNTSAHLLHADGLAFHSTITPSFFLLQLMRNAALAPRSFVVHRKSALLSWWVNSLSHASIICMQYSQAILIIIVALGRASLLLSIICQVRHVHTVPCVTYAIPTLFFFYHLFNMLNVPPSLSSKSVLASVCPFVDCWCLMLPFFYPTDGRCTLRKKFNWIY